MRASGFPIPEDVAKLSAPPSKVVTSYKKLWAYAVHYRCDSNESASYATYDCGVSLLESEVVTDSIDVGILEDIYMVSFGSLNVVVMKISWLKHVDQGRRCIKKDAAGFWTALYSKREDPGRRNRFLLPRNAAQVFFVHDEQEPDRVVIILHEPRSARVVGFTDPGFYGVGETEFLLETPLDSIDQHQGRWRGSPSEVPEECVRDIDANLGVMQEDEVFEDTEFAEDAEDDVQGI